MLNIFEDPTLFIVIGLLVEVILGMALWQTGRGQLLWWMAGAAAFTLLGIVVERLVVTPREQITIMLDDARRAVAANDLPGTLRFVAASAKEERTLVTDSMRRWKFSDAAIHGLEIELPPGRNPQRADARLTGVVSVRDSRGEFSCERFPARLQVQLERIDGRWQVTRLIHAEPWRPQAL